MNSQTSDDYKGIIVEESLAEKGILEKVRIKGTRVSQSPRGTKRLG